MKTTVMGPARQSLARELTPVEIEIASALESAFATGQHTLAAAAAELQRRGVSRPSGAAEPWTPEILEVQLRSINSSLDAAYSGREWPSTRT